ncbi:MAG: threonine-phosphate decarboxylase CobD [Pseudomonadota bacterium]
MSGDLKHGGALDVMRRQFPDARLPWIDLSTGVNPWPYEPLRFEPAGLTRLPLRSDDDACRAAMAAAWGAASASILLAPGSELLIRLLPSLIRAQRVAILSPTYADHAHAWRDSGAEITETDDPLGFADAADVVLVCNPNNPDGRVFAPEALREAHSHLSRRGGWLVIDEAYADLDPGLSLAADGGADGLILLRSFGKFFGLPGLRLGALIAPDAIRQAMADRLGVWPVSGVALDIGARAYLDLNWQATNRTRLRLARQRLDDLWTRAGQKMTGGTSLFGFTRVENANAAWRTLAQQGVYVRRFNWSSKHLRIGLPQDAESETRLTAALSLLD